MSINNNIWEVAEAYLSGALPEADVVELKNRLATETTFANEFYEITGLIRSFEESGKQKRFRAMLRDIQAQQEAGKPAKTALRIPLSRNFWRTAAVAAGVAVLTSAVTYSILNPSIRKHDSQYNTISREVGAIKKGLAQQQAEQDKLKEIVSKNNKPAPPPSDVKYTGTGFAITNDGYFVTADHVIHHNGKGDFDSVYIQTHDGQYFKAHVVTFSADADIAVLKVDKKNFHFGKGDLPYTFAKDKAALGDDIFTLGYPKDDIVYSKGYISSKNGFDGDNEQYTLELPAGHGQSGSPVIDNKGNLLGILTAIGSQSEANTYAVTSRTLIDLVHKQTASTLHLPKANKLGGLSREQQIEKMENYTLSVKVYKK